MSDTPSLLVCCDDGTFNSGYSEDLQKKGIALNFIEGDALAGKVKSQISEAAFLIVVAPQKPLPTSLLSELCSSFPERPVLVLNHNKDTRAALKALEIGVARYLEEPVERKKVIKYIAKALRMELPSRSMVVERAKADWLEINAPASYEFAERLDFYLSNLIRSSKFSQEQIDDLSYAFLEMVNNAIEWGCKRDISKNFKITYTVFGDKVIFKIEDEGEGFDFRKFFAEQDITAGDNHDLRVAEGKREGGLGIYLVRQCMDDLKFNHKGNVVYLTKYFPQD